MCRCVCRCVGVYVYVHVLYDIFVGTRCNLSFASFNFPSSAAPACLVVTCLSLARRSGECAMLSVALAPEAVPNCRRQEKSNRVATVLCILKQVPFRGLAFAEFGLVHGDAFRWPLRRPQITVSR